MAGREGLVDTAVKTAETGYMQVTVRGTGASSCFPNETISWMLVGAGGSACVLCSLYGCMFLRFENSILGSRFCSVLW